MGGAVWVLVWVGVGMRVQASFEPIAVMSLVVVVMRVVVQPPFGHQSHKAAVQNTMTSATR